MADRQERVRPDFSGRSDGLTAWEPPLGSMHLRAGVNRFLLPARERCGRTEYSAMPPGSKGADAGRTILVVDDDCDQRSAFADLLAYAGYQVVVACDGQEALDLLFGGLSPAVIVLDLAMPRMSGWAFLERVRATEHSSVPVLVTSGDARARPPIGADACLDKPVDARVFRSLVGQLCSAAAGQVPQG